MVNISKLWRDVGDKLANMLEEEGYAIPPNITNVTNGDICQENVLETKRNCQDHILEFEKCNSTLSKYTTPKTITKLIVPIVLQALWLYIIASVSKNLFQKWY